MARMMSCKRTENQMTMEPVLASEEVTEPWGFIDLMEGGVTASHIKDTFVVDIPKVSIGREGKNTLRFHDIQVSRNQYEITCSKKNDERTIAELKNTSTRKNCRLNGQELTPNATLELLNNDVFTVCTIFNLRWRYYDPKNPSSSLDPSKPNLRISDAKSIHSNRPPTTVEVVVKPSSEPPAVVPPSSQGKMKDIDMRKAVLKNETHKLVQKAKAGSSTADVDSINGVENGGGGGDEPGDPNSTIESDVDDLMQVSASDVSQEALQNSTQSQTASDKDMVSTSNQELAPTTLLAPSAPTSKVLEEDEEDEMSAIEKEMQNIVQNGIDGQDEETESPSQPIEKADVNIPSPGPMSMSYSSTTVEVGDGEQDEIDESEYNQEKSGQDEGAEEGEQVPAGDEATFNESGSREPRSSPVFHDEDTQLIVPPTPRAEESQPGVHPDPRSNSLSSDESVSLLDDSRVFVNDGDSTEMTQNGGIEENNEESKVEEEVESQRIEGEAQKPANNDVEMVAEAPASKIVGPTPKRTRGLGSPNSKATQTTPPESPPDRDTPPRVDRILLESDKEEVAVEKPESPSKVTRKRGQSIPPEEGVKKTRILPAKTSNNAVEVNDFSLGAMLLADELFDTSLMVGDREFKFHKAVLSCQSTLFRDEFAKESPSNISLPELKADAFEIALRFAYFGGFRAQDDISGSELAQILRVAEKCGMSRLKEATLRRIFNLQEINPEVGMNLVEIASGGDSDELLDRVLNLVKPIYSEMKKLAKWKEIVFDPKHLKMIQRLALILDG